MHVMRSSGSSGSECVSYLHKELVETTDALHGKQSGWIVPMCVVGLRLGCGKHQLVALLRPGAGNCGCGCAAVAGDDYTRCSDKRWHLWRITHWKQFEPARLVFCCPPLLLLLAAGQQQPVL